MFTKEIPRNEWRLFFDDFSRKYHRWTVDVELLDPNIGAQLEASKLPLEGITAELKDDGDMISIMIGEGKEDHITHNIADPTHVRVEQTERGESEALQIESANGIMTIMHFCSSFIH